MIIAFALMTNGDGDDATFDSELLGYILVTITVLCFVVQLAVAFHSLDMKSKCRTLEKRCKRKRNGDTEEEKENSKVQVLPLNCVQDREFPPGDSAVTMEKENRRLKEENQRLRQRLSQSNIGQSPPPPDQNTSTTRFASPKENNLATDSATLKEIRLKHGAASAEYLAAAQEIQNNKQKHAISEWDLKHLDDVATGFDQTTK